MFKGAATFASRIMAFGILETISAEAMRPVPKSIFAAF
jgi:hypothetical protein